MTNPLTSIQAYEEFVYSLQQSFPAIKVSTLVLKRQGRTAAILAGELLFEKDIRLFVRERIDFAFEEILGYGYEIWQGENKLYWYDSHEHPDDPALASTHPHHKHTPPDIKHNRIPAPGLSFMQPNLPILIQEIVNDLLVQGA